ncbi:MAG: glycosyltransferase [Caldilineaceae bacterium]|nr:glycosyltransferase [Caldilineaceae bacterium]
MRILFLSRWYPFPPNNGSKLRIFNLLHGLQQRHDVTLLTFAEPAEVRLAEEEQRGRGVNVQDAKVQVVTWRPFDPRRVRTRFGYFSPTPRSVMDTYSLEMARKIQQLMATDQIDLVIASQFDMAVYSPIFRHLPALFEEVELGVLYERFLGAKTLGQRMRHGLTWIKHRRFLASLLANFQLCTVASPQERAILLDRVQAHPHVEIVPNSVDVQSYRTVQPVKQAHTLIYTGAFSFAPNYTAMQWFVGEVLPLVRSQVPEAQLIITGDHAGKSLPTQEGVTLAGYVDDVHSLVASATISLAPLQTGGGTRLKILEAMALRTPVVATTKGAEGLEVVSGEHLLIADSPQDFAAAVVSLLRSTELQNRLAENSYRLACAKYDTAVVVPFFLDLVTHTAQTAKR